jgi:hypothetical protein
VLHVHLGRRAEQCRAEQSSAEQSRAVQSRAVQSSAVQSRAVQSSMACVQMERFPGVEEGDPAVLGRELPAERKAELLTARIKRYAQRVYKRVSAKPETDVRVAGICQRENSFYVDTVRAFRDRRYEYKGLVKRWKRNLGDASAKVRPLPFLAAALAFNCCAHADQGCHNAAAPALWCMLSCAEGGVGLMNKLPHSGGLPL